MLLFAGGSGVTAWITVIPPRWHAGGELAQRFATTWLRYAAQFLPWLALVQASIVSVVTFAVIVGTGWALGSDPRFTATEWAA